MSQGPQWPPPKGRANQPADTVLYDALGVPPTASTEEIRTAFKRASLKHHPDKGGDESAFVIVKEASSVLQDAVERKCYDAYGMGYRQVPNIQAFRQQFVTPDTYINVALDLPELLNGTSKVVQFTKIEHGVASSSRVTIEVPKGAIKGHRIVVPRSGNKELNKVPGSLVVTLDQHPFPNWSRHGQVLVHKCDLTLKQMLSGQLTVEHPDGSKRQIKIVAMQPNTWYHVEDFYINCSCTFPTHENATPTITEQALQALVRESMQSSTHEQDDDDLTQRAQQCPMQ